MLSIYQRFVKIDNLEESIVVVISVIYENVKMNAIFDQIAFTTHYFNTPVWFHYEDNSSINITESLVKTLD